METKPNGPGEDIDILLSRSNTDPTTGAPLAVGSVNVKKKSKAPLIFTLLFLLLAGGGGAAYYYFVMNKPQTPVVQSTPKPTPSVKVSLSEKLVNEVKPLLKGNTVAIKDSEDGRGETADGTLVYSAASYMPSGYKFTTAPGEQHGIATSSAGTDRTTVDTDYDTIVSYLKDHTFTTTTTEPDRKLPKHMFYLSDDIVCSVDVIYDVKNMNYVGLGCADVESYVETAKEAKPLYEAYASANPQLVATATTNTPIFIGKPTIENGDSNHKNANALLANGNQALFYMEPNQSWRYFTDTKATLLCAKFDTDVLEKAFSGAECLDATGKVSKVTVTASTSTSPSPSTTPPATP